MIGVKEAAKLKNVSEARITQLCRENRIVPTPKKHGRDWAIADSFEVIEAGRTRPGKIDFVKGKK